MIADKLKLTTKKQYDELLYAFKANIPHHAVLPDNKHFVGVNIKGVPNLHVVETLGDWSYGSIKGTEDE